MEEIAEEFIGKYFKELMDHHQNIFGIHKDANLTNVNYIAIHEDIFAFVNHLRQIDDRFEEELLDVLLDDIINMVHLINSLTHQEHDNLEKIYEKFEEETKKQENKDEFFNRIFQEFKLVKNSLFLLLNTKFFYLDKYIWHKIKKSKELRQLLKIKNLQDVKSTVEYIKQTTIHKTYMALDYSSFHIELHKNYSEKGIEEIRSYGDKPIEIDPNEPIEKLIRYKKHIPYFKGIEDEDIREIVKDVKFQHYEVHELVIREYDDTNEIFFLVEGECRVSLRQKALGTITRETIFGEFSFITRQPRSATVKTNKNSIVISFHFDLESFEQNPCLFSQLYKNISEELVRKVYHINKEHISI